MTIEHRDLTGASLHNSKVLTFTGDPTAYSPPEVGILVCCLTSPNGGRLYRTTGTTVGALASLAMGEDGEAATISIGNVETVPHGEAATVTNGGTSQAVVLDFELPAGSSGSVTVGVVTPPDISVEITNSGDEAAAVLDFDFSALAALGVDEEAVIGLISALAVDENGSFIRNNAGQFIIGA